MDDTQKIVIASDVMLRRLSHAKEAYGGPLDGLDAIELISKARQALNHLETAILNVESGKYDVEKDVAYQEYIRLMMADVQNCALALAFKAGAIK